MIAYVLPTRNRPVHLARTLDALGRLPPHPAEVIIADNASGVPPRAPVVLPNGLIVRILCLQQNMGAAARNAAVAAADASSEWIVMLDDDSHPECSDIPAILRGASRDTAAISGEIRLTHAHTREAGGLPEVFVGCGAAIRRDAFTGLGGYDPAFSFYAEEYDLSAKLIRAGYRVVLDRRLAFAHEKTTTGRDMNLILRRLTRNNAWVMQRYAPDAARAVEVRRTIRRYARIAAIERAEVGYLAARAELAVTLRSQTRTPMTVEEWDRFTGLACVRRSLQLAFSMRPFRSASLIDRGKNDHVIEQALRELGVSLTADHRAADALVIGTLSPGPLLDAFERRAGLAREESAAPVLSPWHELTDQSAATPVPRTPSPGDAPRSPAPPLADRATSSPAPLPPRAPNDASRARGSAVA